MRAMWAGTSLVSSTPVGIIAPGVDRMIVRLANIQIVIILLTVSIVKSARSDIYGYLYGKKHGDCTEAAKTVSWVACIETK